MRGMFRQSVVDAKLEFFNIGGDPQELMCCIAMQLSFL